MMNSYSDLDKENPLKISLGNLKDQYFYTFKYFCVFDSPMIQHRLKMMVIHFLILFSAFLGASGWGVINYPEFIKHLEDLEKYKDIEGKRYDDPNQKTLFNIFREFGKSLLESTHSIDNQRMMKIRDLVKRTFPTSGLDGDSGGQYRNSECCACNK